MSIKTIRVLGREWLKAATRFQEEAEAMKALAEKLAKQKESLTPKK